MCYNKQIPKSFCLVLLINPIKPIYWIQASSCQVVGMEGGGNGFACKRHPFFSFTAIQTSTALGRIASKN